MYRQARSSLCRPAKWMVAVRHGLVYCDACLHHVSVPVSAPVSLPDMHGRCVFGAAHEGHVIPATRTCRSSCCADTTAPVAIDAFSSCALDAAITCNYGGCAEAALYSSRITFAGVVSSASSFASKRHLTCLSQHDHSGQMVSPVIRLGSPNGLGRYTVVVKGTEST